MAGKLRTRLRNRRNSERDQIRAAEDRALAEMEGGSQAIRDFASRQPTYEQLLGDMPTSSRLELTPEDQRLMGIQNRALEQLETVGREGWTAEDRAALDAAQRQTALQEQAQRQALMQQAQMRGAGGGGAAIAGALMAQQAGANRNADVAAQLGMAGRDRALAAMETGAGLAGQMGAQNMQRAGAIDAFNQWATGHRSNAMQGTFDNAGAAAGMQASWAPQVAAFQQDRANQVRERQQQRRDRWMQGIKGALDFGANLGMGIAGLANSGGGGGNPAATRTLSAGASGVRGFNRNGAGGTR